MVSIQHIITFGSNTQYSDTQALHDMLKMITEHYGHIDFIIESVQAERFKRWTIVYTSTVDLSFRCPESCYIFINKESKMINFIVGFICGIIIATIVISLGVYDMIIGDIDISDETLKNHSVQMVINRIPDDLDKRHYLVFRVFHKEDRNENA